MCESGAPLLYLNRLSWQVSLTAISRPANFTQAPTAIVSGDVTAQNVTIDGRVHGVIVADEVYLSATAHFEGQLNCHGIAIDNGAYVDAKFIEEPVTNG
ncbi:polymer-forming cytoskeletal protein [Alphaproteobacteria bacterium]|nr:polymer-forming cytoskeletal protein [Alphaproteobacteria bacterium]